MAKVHYSIKNNRLKRAYSNGFVVEKDSFYSKSSTLHEFLLEPIDALEEDALWGRFSYEVETEGNVATIVYVGASNEKIDLKRVGHVTYKSILRRVDARRFAQEKDFLLYDLKGQYLYIAFEIAGEGNVKISSINVDRQGDNFMQTFPQVYQERGSFFHRYMSIFSSVYNDMEVEIDNLPKLLDLDTCDVNLLPIYGRWLGLDVGDGFLQEEVLRNLVKEAYLLNRMKGTKWCLERITEILLGEKAVIIERNTKDENLGIEQAEEFNKLYGSSIYDVTILIQNDLTETMKAQLVYILEQYIPVRCKLHVIEIAKTGTLDSYSYMDLSSRVYTTDEGQMDNAAGMDGAIILA